MKTGILVLSLYHYFVMAVSLYLGLHHYAKDLICSLHISFKPIKV